MTRKNKNINTPRRDKREKAKAENAAMSAPMKPYGEVSPKDCLSLITVLISIRPQETIKITIKKGTTIATLKGLIENFNIKLSYHTKVYNDHFELKDTYRLFYDNTKLTIVEINSYYWLTFKQPTGETYHINLSPFETIGTTIINLRKINKDLRKHEISIVREAPFKKFEDHQRLKEAGIHNSETFLILQTK